MLITKRKTMRIKKAIALFMLFTLANQVLTPSIAYALTAGPTAPEATNFEPVDTTDMVNSLTGSFTYGMPLLEVPGPEGSYPLSLSYHASIQPNEEASWVGLGWSLNPGAIARNVNGYPDDWNGGAGTTSSYWSGGQTTTYSIGIAAGFANTPASVNFGLSFSQDTYKGFGVGFDAGVGVSLLNSTSSNGNLVKGPLSIGANVGISPYGDAYAGANVNYFAGEKASEGLKLSSSLGVQTNFKTTSAGFNAGVSFGGASLLGASIGTGNIRASFSVGGGSSTSVNDANSGKISSYSNSFVIPIPILPLLSLSLGYNYVRYWSATTASFTANGVVNNRYLLTVGDWTNTDDDNYSIPDPVNAPGIDDPLTTPGGTFPNFDDYSVTAQGLGGSIRPYAFSSLLFNQSRVNNNDHSHDVYDETFPYATNFSIGGKWQFRFINDLSNSYRQQHLWVSDQVFGFDSNPQYGNNAGSQPDGTYGYDPLSNRLEGTNHIEYFTNAQISNGTAAARGFVTCPDEAGFLRANCPSGQIGGFMITNSSGVTYHYALPAYSKNELFHSEIINSQPNGFSSTDLNKTTPYAYTWYLTAITGPDYVSRGATAGLIDPSDWGYWVKFDYGQWASNYNWVTPSQGLIPDIDGVFQTVSAGSKEIYYLDAIQTRTHTAIFEKELRADGKGACAYAPGGPPVGYPIQSYIPATTPVVCQGGNTITYYPTATLRLKEILLLQNDQLNVSVNTLRASSTNYNISYTYNNCGQTYTEIVHEGQNVIDSADIAANPAILNNCLRRIVFNHDYSLCPGVPNSYDPTGANTYIASPATPTSFLGKLTLLSVDFQGIGGTPMTPPIQFQYDLDPTSQVNQGNITITNAPANPSGFVKGPTYAYAPNPGSPPTTFNGLNYPVCVNQPGTITVQTTGVFNTGDILSFQVSGITYYCTLLSSTPNVPNGFNVLFLNNSPGLAAINQTVATVKTKNPPYNYDAYDNWMCYKSDYIADPANTYLSRFTTPVSNFSTDVWSLRKIVSSVGANININYDGNTFNRSVLNNVPPIIVSSRQINSDGTMDMMASVPPNINLSQFFQIGGVVTGPLAFYRIGTSSGFGGTSTQGYNQVDLGTYPQTTIVSVVGNDIKVKLDPNLVTFLQTTPISGVPISSASVTNLVTGNLTPNMSGNFNYGGGIRVKNIIVDDLNGNVQQTSYNYGSLGYPGSTSGVTSYLPSANQDNLGNAMNSIYESTSYKLSPSDLIIFTNAYRSILNKSSSYLTAVAREVPAPGVLYETVAVNDFSILPNGTAVPIEGTTLYQYEVFKPEMIGLEQYQYESPHSTAAHTSSSGSGYTIINQAAHDVSIKDYTSRVGNLKRVVTYDNQGNILTEKINHYLYDDLENTSFQNQVNNYEPRLATFTGVSNYNGVSYNDMGVILERYATARASTDLANVSSNPVNSKYDEMLVMSNVETFPAIQTGATQIDYKNGTSMNQTNLAFDFYTGAVTQTLTTDSYGNRFISMATPAYMAGGISSLAYPALGLKTHDDDAGATQHKQMLSQQASNYTFSVDVNNNPIGVVTAAVQTWSTSIPLDPNGNPVSDGSESNIWRMNSSYTWMPAGSATNNVQPYSTFADFYGTSNGGSSNASWKKTAQITQYNVYSNALEATDINNNFAATRMGYGNSKVLITGGAARYNDIAYAGAEDALLSSGNFSSNISPGGGTVVTDSTKSHTGVNSLMVPANSNGFIYTVPITSLNPVPQNYSVSVWVKPPASGSVNLASLYYQGNGGTVVAPVQTYAKSAAGCYLLEMTVPASAITGSGNLVVGCTNGSAGTLYFDDFRFQPTAAAATAYVYDSQTGDLTYILDNNNLYTRFQYDAIGRLVRTYREVLGKTNTPLIKAVSYNYGSFSNNGNNNGNSSEPYVYYNVAMSQVFSNQNCGTVLALPITYTVPAWTYSSNVSQQAANNLAQNDISANGQAYANLHGPCDVGFSLQNTAAALNYSVSFTNTVTQSQLSFPFPSLGSTAVSIPPGTYNVTVSPAGPTNYVFRLGDLTTPPAAPGCVFNNVNITAGGNEVSLSISTN